jgi:outer membrane PBP1 activator LpoA protein
VLYGCASAPPQDATTFPDSGGEIESLPADTGEETVYTARIRQAEVLLFQRQLLPAASILRDIDNSKLTAGERARTLAMETELFYLQGNTAKALRNLAQTLPRLGALDPALSETLEDWQLRLVLTEEGPLSAARLADRMLLATEQEKRAAMLREFIWHNLQRTPASDMEDQLLAPISRHWSGWLELALQVADVMESPQVQVTQLELWVERHPDHRAAEALPGGLAALLDGAGEAPGRIALLLPLSADQADRGHALLEGYMAARYEGRRRGWPEQELMVMDSAAQPDFNAAYEVAVRAGAELVIGPLTGEELLSWRPAPGQSVPLMTLAWLPPEVELLSGLTEVANSPGSGTDTPDATASGGPAGGQVGDAAAVDAAAVDAAAVDAAALDAAAVGRAEGDGPAGEFAGEGLPGAVTSANLPPVQLDLAPVDEARQLAQVAYDSGARNALLIKPTGEWGQLMGDAVVEAWQEREGRIQAMAVYSGQADYSTSLKSALKLSESEARAARVRQLLGERTEFTPRRRKDIDIVFLLSNNPQDARSIKPLIAFHYAGDLPVYATSHIHSGKLDPQRDRDLNGIRLLEMPWLLSPRENLQAGLGDESTMADMHALGADAFMLNWRLAQLRATTGSHIRGSTGLLSMDNRGRVHRELQPARIEQGVPTAR